MNDTNPELAETYDVVVVGARPAGAATAMLLARSGHRALVLERAAPGTDTISTHALMRAGVLQLTRWGLLDHIAAAGTPPVHAAVYRYGGERRSIPIKSAHGVSALYAPRRTVLDPTLAAAAREAGADVRYHTRVTDLLWDRDRVVGVRATIDGIDREIRARLVVGADGIRSSVAHRAGAAVEHVARWHSAISYGYWSDLPVEGYEWAFHPDACAGAIPTGDGLVCVFAGATPRRIGRGGIDVIRSITAVADPDLDERLERATAPTTTRTWPGTAGFLRTAHGPGWALVGDAGYFKDPLVAHGLTDALRDAELLARAVDAGLTHGDLDATLDDYHLLRNELSLPLLRIADRMASQQWDDAELDTLLRHMSAETAREVEMLAGLEAAGPPALAEVDDSGRRTAGEQALQGAHR